MLKTGQLLDRCFRIIFFCLVVGMLVAVWWSPNFQLINNPFLAVVIGVVLALGLFWGISRYPKSQKWLRHFTLSYPWVAVILVGLLAYQLICYWQLTVVSSWDPGTIIQNVAHPSSYFYFSANYNNVFLLLLEQGIQHTLVGTIAPDLLQALLIVNAVVLDLAALGVYCLGRRLQGPRLATHLFLLGLLFWGLSPWVLEFYSDTLGLFMVVVLLLVGLLTVQATRLRFKIPLALLYAVCTLLAYLLKPTTLILAIAWVLVLGVKALQQKKSLKQWLVGLVFILGIGGFVAVGYTTFNHYTYDHLTFTLWGQTKKLNPDLRTPPTHFIAMGLKGIGGYNAQDVKDTWTAKTYQERDALNRQKIKTRLKNYGPVGYLKFLAVKFNNNVANGNFAWDGVVAYRSNLIHQPATRLSQVSSWFNYPDGRYRNWMRFINQITWITLLAFVLVSSSIKSLTKNPLLRLCQITIIGVLFYLLIFEGGTTRYLFMWLPCFIISGAYGIDKSVSKTGQALSIT